MKKIALLLALFTFAIFAPLQASAASLYEVRETLKKGYYGEYSGDIYDAKTIPELMKLVKDPYTVYYTAEEYKNLYYAIEQQTVGIGVVVEKHDKGVYISSVINDGPASKAGIQVGDIITHANNSSLVGLPINEAVTHITGKENTKVTLTLLHTNGSSSTKTLTRQVIQSPNVVSSLLYGNVGYIYMASFSENGAKEVSNAIGKLKKAGATKFIFDLQQNGGGYVHTSSEIISLFPAAQYAFLQVEKSGQYLIPIDGETLALTRTYNKFPNQVALLIDRGSASASEMTAGALQDQKLATIYGKQSYGKGTMQDIKPFSDGTALKYTIAEFRTPNGNAIKSVGVKPDIDTATPLEDAHFDLLKSSLTAYKAMPAMKNVATTKAFTLTFNKDVLASSVMDNIELVQLGEQKIDFTASVSGSKVVVTPKEPLKANAQYMLIAHPAIKALQDGKVLKRGIYMHITIAK